MRFVDPIHVILIMATDEILRLCEALSLSEEDGPILDIAKEVQADGIRSVEHCLVGKILSRRKVNREAFRGTIEQIWGTVGRIEIEMVGDNVFVFHFQSLEDKAMVWSRGPWHFDKNLIVLEKPVGPGAISQLRFEFSEFWIHIYNIPLACMNLKSSLNQKLSGINAGISPSEAIVIDPGGKRKDVEVAGENLAGKKQKLLETDISAESAEQARRGL
ncbi:hypothetical protein ACOSQ4_006854 [Xanthoceras sorbifolium]